MDQASVYIDVLDLTDWCDFKVQRERFESIQRRLLSNRGVLMSSVCRTLLMSYIMLLNEMKYHEKELSRQKLKLPCKLALLTWSHVNPFQWVNLFVNAV